MSRKKQKVSLKCSQTVDFCNRSSISQKVLSDLPDEILAEIFGYLTPDSLVQISRLGIQRLTSATSFKSADFSSCNTINNENLQFFFVKESPNLNNIREINFNNVFFALPSTLTTCIQKCTNVTKLYVLNCGLECSHISSIFSSCKTLEELYWSLPGLDDGNSKLEMPSMTSNSLKKLCLQFQLQTRNCPNFMSFLEMCPAVQVVYVTFTPYYITTIPAKLSTRYYCYKTILSGRNVAVNFVLACSSNVCPRRIKVFMQDVNLENEERPQENLTGERVVSSSYLTCHSAFLQIFAKKEFLDELQSPPNESIKSLDIILDDNFRDIVSHLPRIAKMGGKTLKHLSLYKQENPTTPARTNYGATLCISSILCAITFSSCNLTVLSLSELHMAFVFPLPFNLKQLKVLNLCACCLAPPPVTPDAELQRTMLENMFAQRDFEEFVLTSNKVEEFGLYGCKTCPHGPSDEKLNCISAWKELKSLTLVRVSTVRQCQFLTHVANMCPRLKMVDLVILSEPTVCHFIPSIVHILKKSKELFFLRINQPGFYPMDSLFWKGVGSAMNLQGLCLSTAVTTYIANKPILEAINNLPYLHLFHLKAKGACDSLATHVKRIMHGKGVKLPKISAPRGEPFECPRTHFTMV